MSRHSSVQPFEPERAQVDYNRPVIPPGATPRFDVSTVTHPNLFGKVLSLDHCLMISNDYSLCSFGNALSDSRAQLPVGYIGGIQAHPTNFLGYRVKMGPSTPTNPSHHTVHPSRPNYSHSTDAPVASTSRQALKDIQPILHCGSTLDPVVIDRPPERRQRMSKASRQQPYNKKNKGTRPSKESSKVEIPHLIPASTIPSSDDMARVKAVFRTLQAMKCPLLVGGQACGQSIKSAQSMSAHLASETHKIRPDNRKTGDSGQQGQCPCCEERMGDGSIHRHIMTSHFYQYVCPVEGCGRQSTRSHTLGDHCFALHGLEMSGKEDFAVCIFK